MKVLGKKLLFSFIISHGYTIVEESDRIVIFQSDDMEVRIVFNKLENSQLISIGKKNSVLYPINDSIIKNVFHSDLSLEKVDTIQFLENIYILLQKPEGIKILKGNIDYLVDISYKESVEYRKQRILREADILWEKQDYKSFIKSINKIIPGEVPDSHKIKLNIAKYRLK